MGKKIRIECGGIKLSAELNDTPTAQAIAKALPLESEAMRWGEEVYFDVPVKMALEAGATADVEVGDLGYWPSGPAFCIFFGRTPVSKTEQPRAASPVTLIGKVIGDAKALTKVKDGEKIKLTAEGE